MWPRGLLLYNKLPHNFSSLKQQTLSCSFCVQEFKNGLAGWFCLRVSREVVVKLLARAAVNGRFKGAGGSSPGMVYSHGCWQEASVPCWLSTIGHFHRTAWVFTWHVIWLFHKWVTQERARRKLPCLLLLSFFKCHIITSAILFIINSSLNLAHIQGDGTRCLFLKRKTLW